MDGIVGVGTLGITMDGIVGVGTLGITMDGITGIIIHILITHII